MAYSRFSRTCGNAALVAIALLVCTAAVIVPASAATKYVSGSPDLSASVTGTNEFFPGEDATITILIRNTGVSTLKQLNQGTIDYEDLPTTAKFSTVGLSSGTDAIIIKSDPQFVGDIPAGGAGSTVSFSAKISTNATIGEYQLPVTISYQAPDIRKQEVADVYEYSYTKTSTTIPVTIRIKPEVKITVVEAIPDTLSAGTSGYVVLKIRNDGPESGTKASVKLTQSGSSAIIPTDSTAFVGDFPSGGIISSRFKISASKDAADQIYPVDVSVTYTNREGEIVTSRSESVGIPVSSKISFSVTSPVPSVSAGSHDAIAITYRNNGNTTVHETQSRITPHGGVTAEGTVAYLGDIPPGETATALYDIAVSREMQPGTYNFDSKLRFRDALGNSLESDTVPVTVQVLPAKAGTIAGIPTTILVAGLILVVLAAGIGYMAYLRKTKPQ
ncbi:S-layer protein [Methanoregula sp.]|uniref:COG1361 S-layer family protein n=1 Tax=Methanoregula sp. TaxID=2052170 RepID=UPI002620BCEB|nr:S-layer protein [Methanoregula sp.]MDD5142541.1 S-layer protein [Methanoregula sp.]